MTDIFVYLPYEFDGVGASYTPVAITRHFASAGMTPRIYIGTTRRPLPEGLDRALGHPSWLPRKGRFYTRGWATWRIERRLLADVRLAGPGAVVWLWPDASLALVRALKKSGAFLIREMINTHRGTAKRILDAESQRLGLPPQHAISDESILLEQQELQLMDLVVSPSECVDDSLLEWNIPAARILKTSFGWDPDRLSICADRPRPSPSERITALFVGRISIRKGVHLALDAWQMADVEGTFRLVGNVERDMEPILARHVATGKVVHEAFTSDVASVYASADFMLFPTLEEGAPLVCYEAGGCGVPILTSPMGAARFVEDGVNGRIVAPHDSNALATAIRQLADDPALRGRMSANIRAKAMKYRWEDAASERIRLLKARRNASDA